MPDIQTPAQFRETLLNNNPSQWERLIAARDAAIRKQEREACAKIADDRGWDRTAAAIRAREPGPGGDGRE